MILPEDFIREMQELLRERYPLFEDAYQQIPYCGLRFNTLKLSKTDYKTISDFSLQPIEWCEDGFYYDVNQQPGKHPFHEAGLYYIQEPSAMKPVEEMNIKMGDRVLDLCAAPGGKATQIACKLQNTGLLLANEINRSRSMILAGNFERFGVKQAVVCNETPKRLADSFPEYFDKVLVDAPCSGSGMFRKEPQVISEWSKEVPYHCAKRQREILRSAVGLLKSGGILLYSTCSFSACENEEITEWLVREYPEFKLIKEERLWPFTIKGEGHYYAIFRKDGTCEIVKKYRRTKKHKSKVQIKEWLNYNKIDISLGDLVDTGNQLNMIDSEFPDVSRLKVIRYGLPLGEIRSRIFIPHHSLAMVLKPHINLSFDETVSYLAGQEIRCDHPDQWVVVGYGGYALGWGKMVKGTLKNHLPKGLRRNY